MTAPAPSTDTPDLAKQLDDIVSKAQSIVETATAAGRDLTPDEDRQHVELTTRAEKIGEQLTRSRTLDRIRSAATVSGDRHLSVERGAAGGDNSSGGWSHDPFSDPRDVGGRTRGRDPWGGEVVDFGRSATQVVSEFRARALSAIEQMPGSNDRVRQASALMLEQFDDEHGRLSRLAVELSRPAYLRAFAELARNGGHAGDLEADQREALTRVRTLARSINLLDTNGGVLVPWQLDPSVIITANGSRNDIRKIARQVVATGDVWNGVSAGAVSWSWDAEETEVSDDSPVFAQPSIPIYKATGFVPISIEAMADAANITQEIGRLLAAGKDILEAAAFSIGSGVGQPTGVVTGLTGTGVTVNAATADTLAVGDLYNIQGALPARYRGNASWLASNQFYNRARQFDSAGGSSLWAQLGDDRPAQLLGKPIFECEDMDGTINANQHNYMAVFGDFENYTIADRVGVSVEFLQMLFGASGRPKGQRGWYAFYRTGAQVTNPSGLRLLDV